MVQKSTTLFALAALALLAGCSSGTDNRFAPTVTVTGHVTLDGKPIPEGEIQFTSDEDRRNGSEASVFIKQGQYTAQVTNGTKQVRIYAHKAVGAADATGSQSQVQWIPAKYNSRSELEAVVSDEPATLDFELTK
ncbi:hypothetical protein AB1K70_05215 [Bremerella sp. JC770]|uniref:hypothetical protein n=1 Tax=Bremerella sp. JC770 TaxID=3232137 RepID=UPI0034596FE9